MKTPTFFALPVILALLACVLVAHDAAAQCGAEPSSCTGCHDGTRAGSPERIAWHEDHAFSNLCVACHGGRGDAADLAQAHVGLVAVLDDVERCRNCHTDHTDDFVARYRNVQSTRATAAVPGATPGSEPSVRTSPRVPAAKVHGETVPNIALGTVTAIIGAVGALVIVRRERARSHRSARNAADPSLRD